MTHCKHRCESVVVQSVNIAVRLLLHAACWHSGVTGVYRCMELRVFTVVWSYGCLQLYGVTGVDRCMELRVFTGVWSYGC